MFARNGSAVDTVRSYLGKPGRENRYGAYFLVR